MVAPAELLARLIQFDTTNPPGNEAACVDYLRTLIEDAGIATETYADDPARPNLIARIRGRGEAPPLLLYGHVDVVTTENQTWTHPPFEGRVADGFVWGRGALDMKGGVAMMVSAFLRARREGFTPAGDVILAILSDEENGGDHGARFLVEQHPELFAGVRHAIGEFGGFPMYVAGRKFYAVQVAEKSICWLGARVRGPAGHGSLPMRGGAAAKLGALLTALDGMRLPVRMTEPVRLMLERMAASLPDAARPAVAALMNPDTADAALAALGPVGRFFDALLHDTVNVTIVRGGTKVNVIPAELEIECDARLLPGRTPDDLLADLRAVSGDDVEWRVVRHDPGPADADLAWLDGLSAILRDMEPDAVVVPLLLSGSTDGRFFSRLGIQTYGFLPMNLAPDLNFIVTIHAADERIPVSAVDFGAEAVYRALTSYAADQPSAK